MTRTRRVLRRINTRPTIRPTALVVDADAQQRELIAILLAESGLDVIQAASSEEAVNALRDSARQIVLIVTAMNLPSFMDGARLAIYAQQWPWIRVVVTSQDDDVAEGLPHPAVIMHKPWLPLNMLIQAEKAVATGHNDLVSRPLTRLIAEPTVGAIPTAELEQFPR
jgi:CheY-like chemotaxis protein